MKRTLPDYLSTSGCQDDVRYDWAARPQSPELDPEVYDRLTRLSQRAVLAFAAGSAEWLVYRLDPLCDGKKAWDVIDMAWASIVQLRYSAGPECWCYHATVESSWEGPINGPIRRGLMSLEAAFIPEYRTDPAQKASWVDSMTHYVMSEPAAYQHWRERVLTRLEDLHSHDPSDEVGEVIPREFLDPERNVDPEHTELLVQKFLASLDHESNHFLSAPEEMLEESGDTLPFVGTPYRFDINQDREQRQLWSGGYLLQREP